MTEKLKANWEKAALTAILLLTAWLALWKIWELGDGNAYYTAAVKSMLTSRRNFFFVSFDPGGFIAVDKPPLGLWLQCLSCLVFGVGGWSAALPEALCSVGSVAVTYSLVRRGWGAPAALLAALLTATTPIFIAVSRTNCLDASLVFVCLLALLAAVKAAEGGGLKWLVLSMALLGLGFNIKMFQAFMFLPAVCLVYLFTAEPPRPKRFLHLALSVAVLLAVSLSWCVAADLTPAENRPYVGGSVSNSALELAVGYNGILRALPIKSAALSGISGGIDQVPNEGAAAGPLRLFNKELAGQISWGLIMAVFGLAALAANLFGRDPAPRRKSLRSLLLWGGLFVPMYAYVSVTGHVHRYYLIMFAPCLGALGALAVTELYRRSRHLLLPAALLAAGAVQVLILITHYVRYSTPLAAVIIAGTSAAAALLALPKILKKDSRALKSLAACLALPGLLAAPVCWSLAPIRYGDVPLTPFAGPPDVSFPTNHGKPIKMTFGWQMKWYTGESLRGDIMPQDLVDYVIKNDNGSRWLIAVPNSMYAAFFILDYGKPVMALGGFAGLDRAVAPDRFKELVLRGELQYYYLIEGLNMDLGVWVKQNGRLVDPKEYSANPPAVSFAGLYDLSGLGAAGPGGG